jgi:abelson tyrosine-protein kinase 1
MHIEPITSTHLTTTGSGNCLGLFDDHALPLPSTSQDIPHSQIIPALTSFHSLQNHSDRERDTADLRQLMQAALQTTSDVEMLEVLQVGHQEMPDAIKTLQRALEHVTERDDDGVEASSSKGAVATDLNEVEGPGASRKRSETILSIDTFSTMSSGYSPERRRDTLDKEFIESGIDALRRMSRGVETSLPSWTITK